jgi:flagellar export protein FliJ
VAKRFSFRLEVLLKLRRQREDEKKLAVATRLREIATVERRKLAFQMEIARHVQVMRDSLSVAQADVDRLKMGRYWLARLRRGVLECDARLATVQGLLAQERAELAEARKQAKVLERLKERQQAAFTAALTRREQRELDEMNSVRFAYARSLEAPGRADAWDDEAWGAVEGERRLLELGA